MNYLNMECDKFVWNKFEQPKAGPKGVGQEARSKVGQTQGVHCVHGASLCQALNNEIPGSSSRVFFCLKFDDF